MSTIPAPLAQIATECQTEGLSDKNVERLAAELAAVFNVQPDGVGILRLEKDSLIFAHPVRLQQVGRLPLNNSNSVAVRSFNTRRAEVSNSFAQAKHTTFFEMVSAEKPGAGTKASRDKQIIQKLMSCPVITDDKAVGVIQISRKGATQLDAGPDFVPADLQKLVAIARTLAKCFK
jgi:hypothetical protein